MYFIREQNLKLKKKTGIKNRNLFSLFFKKKFKNYNF